MSVLFCTFLGYGQYPRESIVLVSRFRAGKHAYVIVFKIECLPDISLVTASQF